MYNTDRRCNDKIYRWNCQQSRVLERRERRAGTGSIKTAFWDIRNAGSRRSRRRQMYKFTFFLPNPLIPLSALDQVVMATIFRNQRAMRQTGPVGPGTGDTGPRRTPALFRLVVAAGRPDLIPRFADVLFDVVYVMCLLLTHWSPVHLPSLRTTHSRVRDTSIDVLCLNLHEH